MSRNYVRAYLPPASLVVCATALSISFSEPVLGRDLGPGESATVNAGDIAESWLVRTGGVLTVTPGGQTANILAIGAGVELSGATVSGGSTFGLSLTRSASVGGSNGTVRDSTISGAGRGVNASFGSSVALNNTTVIGHDNGATSFYGGGLGLVLLGAQGTVTNKSTVQGDKHGILIGADVDFDDAGAVSLLVDGSHVAGGTGSAIYVGSSLIEFGTADATIDIRNGATLSGGNGNLIEVADSSHAKVIVDHSTLSGDITVADGSSADLTLQNNAVLTGNLNNVASLAVASGASWNLTRSASVTNMALDGGTVNLGGSSGDWRTLTLSSLSGSGTFALGTDLASVIGDQLVVTGGATGSYGLAITNTGVDPQQGAGDLKVVSIGSGSASFSVLGDIVDRGTYSYELEQRGNEWFLVQATDDNGGPIVSPGTRSVLGLFSAAPTVWYGELTTLRSRMGELRLGNGEGGGWMRTYGNRYNGSAAAGVGFKQNQYGLSFGADGALPSAGGQWLLGVMGGYSKSDLDFQGGTSGEVDSFYVGLYSTWLGDNGYYVDALIKANRFQNESRVRMSDGQRSKGDYDHNGVGASLEVGRQFNLDDGWFVAPYGQVSALWVEGQSYGLDNGMQATSNHADSFLGKVGTHVGRTYNLEEGGYIQPYVKLAVAHEFSDSNRVSVNGNRFNNDLSGSRGEIGAGVMAQVSERLQLHGDVEYANGEHLEMPFGVNFGLRYSF